MTKSEAKSISMTAGKAIQVLAGVDIDGDTNFPWSKLDGETREQAHDALLEVQKALHYILEMASAEISR